MQYGSDKVQWAETMGMAPQVHNACPCGWEEGESKCTALKMGGGEHAEPQQGIAGRSYLAHSCVDAPEEFITKEEKLQ